MREQAVRVKEVIHDEQLWTDAAGEAHNRAACFVNGEVRTTKCRLNFAPVHNA